MKAKKLELESENIFRNSRDQMYKALVCSYLDYCDTIYHIHHSQPSIGVKLNSSMEKVERIQYQAALVITSSDSQE